MCGVAILGLPCLRVFLPSLGFESGNHLVTSPLSCPLDHGCPSDCSDGILPVITLSKLYKHLISLSRLRLLFVTVFALPAWVTLAFKWFCETKPFLFYFCLYHIWTAVCVWFRKLSFWEDGPYCWVKMKVGWRTWVFTHTSAIKRTQFLAAKKRSFSHVYHVSAQSLIQVIFHC